MNAYRIFFNTMTLISLTVTSDSEEISPGRNIIYSQHSQSMTTLYDAGERRKRHDFLFVECTLFTK